MKRVIVLFICALALCACLTGCGKSSPIVISLEGGGVSFTESTDRLTAKEIETKLSELKLTGSDKPLFDSVKITENTGIFYSAYRFIATTNHHNTGAELKLTVSMSGKPTGVRNGAVEGSQVIFPIDDLSQATEYAVEFEENNTGVILGIIAVLVVIMVVFFFIMKRGSDYGSY